MNYITSDESNFYIYIYLKKIQIIHQTNQIFIFIFILKKIQIIRSGNENAALFQYLVAYMT